MKVITIKVQDDANLASLGLDKLMAIAVEFRIDQEVNKVVRHKKAYVPGASTLTAVMSHYTPAGQFTKVQVRRWLDEAGFSPNSASPTVSGLMRKGNISRIGGKRSGSFKFEKPLTGAPATPVKK